MNSGLCLGFTQNRRIDIFPLQSIKNETRTAKAKKKFILNILFIWNETSIKVLLNIIAEHCWKCAVSLCSTCSTHMGVKISLLKVFCWVLWDPSFDEHLYSKPNLHSVLLAIGSLIASRTELHPVRTQTCCKWDRSST